MGANSPFPQILIWLINNHIRRNVPPFHYFYISPVILLHILGSDEGVLTYIFLEKSKLFVCYYAVLKFKKNIVIFTFLMFVFLPVLCILAKIIKLVPHVHAIHLNFFWLILLLFIMHIFNFVIIFSASLLTFTYLTVFISTFQLSPLLFQSVSFFIWCLISQHPYFSEFYLEYRAGVSEFF